MLGNLFYIVIFTTMAGSLFTFFTLFLRKVLGIPSPLWFGVCGIAFYLIPLIVPYVN